MKTSRIRNHLMIFCALTLFLTAVAQIQFKNARASTSKQPPSNAAITKKLSGPDADDRQPRADVSPDGAKLQVSESYGRLPLSFEVNRGQAPASVRFISRGRGSSLYLTSDEAVLVLKTPSPQDTENQLQKSPSEDAQHGSAGPSTRSAGPETVSLGMKLLGSNRKADIEPSGQLPGVSNYFIGNDPSKWQTGVPTYGRVTYRSVYPGVNLAYHGDGHQLEYDFTLAPNVDPGIIRLSFSGALGLKIDRGGDLLLRLRSGEVRQLKPYIYQEVNGEKRAVEGGYVLRGKRVVGFRVAQYDKTRPLVIDPVFSYSTLLGGTSSDQGNAIAVDGMGHAYVTGSTTSFNFPTTVGAYSTTYANSADVFVTKFDPTGSSLFYSTFIGGTSSDFGNAIALDGGGDAFITGTTNSTNFPTTNGAFQTVLSGFQDAFVCELNSTGSALVYSTFLGGTSGDSGAGIAVDSSGSAYVTGNTSSSNFPTTNGAFQTTLSNSTDAFITKLNSSGTALVYSTYLGGSSSDQGNGIAVDSFGDAYVTGSTGSSNFPTTQGAFQTNFGGTQFSCCGPFFGDAFVTKMNSTGTALVYSTFMGGSADDGGLGIALDSSGNAYIAGATNSANFPTTQGVFRAANHGAYKSTDAGADWSPANSGLPASSITSIAIDRLSPSTLYAGSPGSGVFKSTDGGGTWVAHNFGLTTNNVLTEVVDPTNSSVVYLGTGDHGVFKSTDAGGSWEAMDTGEGGPQVSSLAIDPTTTSTVYAGTGGGCCSGSGVFKTTNGGATWSAQNTGLSSTNVTALAIDPSTPSTLYAAATSFGGGIFKSTNGGSTWVQVLGSNFNNLNVSSLAIDPASPATVYAGIPIQGVVRSTDAGGTWNLVNNGLANLNVSALAVSSTSIVYAATAGGVFKSSNGGGSWTSTNTGLAGSPINTVAVDPSTPSTVYAGSSGVGTDAFVAALNTTGTALVYSTYLGGSNTDEAFGIAVDSNNNAYVTGITNSNNFPTTPGGYQFTGFNQDGFVAKLNSTATSLVYSTYVGGSSGANASGIAVDSSFNAYVTGSTQSNDFPTTPGSYQPNLSSSFNQDAFVVKLMPSPGLLADLMITMTSSPSGPVSGQVQYMITVTNNGPDSAFSVLVTDNLPPSLSPGCCSAFGNTVTASTNSLAPGASFNVNVSATVTCQTTNLSPIVNTATVSSVTPDPNSNNNSATVTNTASTQPPTLTPQSQQVPSAGGQHSVFLSTSGQCAWSVSTNVPWITLNQTQGSGSQTIFFQVAANHMLASRTGMVTVAGQTASVTQLGTGKATQFDFDGDGKADLAVWRAPTGVWMVINSSTQTETDKAWGLPNKGDMIVPGDYDGDGKTDFAIWRSSTGDWWIVNSSNGSITHTGWGLPNMGDIPVPGDYDGDGKTDIAIWRSSTGDWWIINSSNGSITHKGWGLPNMGDVPVQGDYDGDGKTDLAIWRGSTGDWWVIDSSTGAFTRTNLGLASQGDHAVPADYDGDGKTDMAVWNGMNSMWRILRSSDGGTTVRFFGASSAGDIAVPADYDGDGKADIAVWRGPSGQWFILDSSTNMTTVTVWGLASSGDIPVPSAFLK